MIYINALGLIGLILIFVSSALIIIFKNDEISLFELFMTGSNVFRNLNFYVRKDAVHIILILSYLGLACCLIAIYGAIIIMHCPFLKYLPLLSFR